jgi:hypothetical protein
MTNLVLSFCSSIEALSIISLIHIALVFCTICNVCDVVPDVLCKQELESSLASKQASLPSEPAADEEGAVTLVVRMPDGSRQGRRFLKSHKLQVGLLSVLLFYVDNH